MLPGIIFGPALGWVVDRSRGKTAWVVSLLLSGLSVAAIALTSAPTLLVLFIAMESLFSIVFNTAVFKVLPRADGMTDETASSFVVGVGAAAGILAPPLAALVAHVGTNSGFILFGSLYVLVGLLVLVVSPDGDIKIEIEKTVWHEVWLRTKSIKTLKTLLIFIPVILGSAMATSMESVAGVFWLQEVAGGPVGYGILMSAWAIGSLIGAAIAGRKWLKISTTHCLLLGGLLMSAAILIEGLTRFAFVIGIAFIFGGLGNAVHNVSLRNLIYDNVPKEQLAQTWAVVGVAFSVAVGLGNVLGTPGLIHSEERIIIVIAGSLGVLLALGTYAMILARRIPIGDAAKPESVTSE